MSKPTSSWDRVGDRFYRKIQLYNDVFDQDLELENYFIGGAPYSGALALHRDENKVYQYRNADPYTSSIDIYSCAGKLIKRLNWDGRPIRGLGWSEDESLLVIGQDGSVRKYQDLSEDYTPFTLGHGADEHGVVACRFWLSGFVVLLGNNQLISVANYDEPRPKLLAAPPSNPVASWTIIPPAYTLSRSVEVLLAIGETINVVDSTDSEDRMLQNGPFSHLSVSPNCRFLALYTDDGKVWVITSDFQDKLSEYDTKSKTVPRDMLWCGNDAVLLAWEDEVHLIGPNGAASRYYYDAWVHLVADVDGVRLFTNEVCEFIQRVPDVLEDTFKVGSTSPSAVLLDAIDQLEKKSPKADDNIQLIRPRLVDAVDVCIAAAGHEYSPYWQKQLLRAASFGKTVLDAYDSDAFVDMCDTIRTLNAMRHFRIGLPLSLEQYERLNPERLTNRLLTRHEYLLAHKLAEHLQLPTAPIHQHWAISKVRASGLPDVAVATAIVSKLSNERGISYESIASTAHDEGRRQLATSLLDHSPHAAKQVPLLLSMSEDTLALDKAIASGDTDLTLWVLLELRQKLSLATFFRTINSRPVAIALVESTARDSDTDLLRDLYYQDDRRLDAANLLLSQSLLATTDQSPNLDQEITTLKSASRLLSDSRDHLPQKTLLDDAARLLALQQSLDTDPRLFPDPQHPPDVNAPTRPRFTGTPLNHTISTLIQHGAQKRAAGVAAEFRVPERTLWMLRLRALVAARSWRELESIGAKNRRSPIGWEVFVEEIAGAGNLKLAGGTFVGKCAGVSARERAEMYLRCGMVARAGEEAVRAKDGEWLLGLRGRVREAEKGEVERCIGLLERGRGGGR